MEKETNESTEETLAITECPCLGCGLNLLELIGATPPNHLLFRCSNCGTIQSIDLQGKLEKVEAPKSIKHHNNYLG